MNIGINIKYCCVVSAVNFSNKLIYRGDRIISIINFNDREALQYALNSGIINMDDVRNRMREAERQRLLAFHKYKVFQDKDGRWKTTLPDETQKSGRRLIAKRERRDLKDEIISFYREKEETEKSRCRQAKGKSKEEITLKDIFPRWLDFKNSHTHSSSYTKRIYTDWKAFYLGNEIVDIRIVDLTYLYLDKWIHDMICVHRMTKTKYYNMALILRQCLDYACEEEIGIIKSNPMKRIKISGKLFVKRAKPERETQVFQEDEQEKLSKEACARYANRPDCTTPLAVLFNFQVGLRVGELVALKWSDINGNYLHVQRMEIETYSVDGSKENGVVAGGYQIADYTKFDCGVNIDTIRRQAGHEDERTSLKNYCFDQRTENEIERQLESARNKRTSFNRNQSAG